MKSVRLENITKRFGETTALANIDLVIDKGELFFLLGPSGCGKSTLLRLIAGLYQPDSGRILFDDQDVTSLGTEQRNAVMCFQSYALWPHMSVYENVRFGLAVRKLPRDEQDKEVDEALRVVQMQEFADRKPNALSGGQQQRVALARALVVKPDCLLLDEPLSNLDAKLRHEMRGEIERICKASGLTTIYVTHDQKEALSVADRIAVMDKGSVAQVGTPGDLYQRPKTAFVADFMGETNLLKGRIVSRSDGKLYVQTATGIMITGGSASLHDEVTISIRPEQMRIIRNGNAGSIHANRLQGKVVESTFLGESSEYVIVVNDQRLKIISAPPVFDRPTELIVEFDPKDAVALPE